MIQQNVRKKKIPVLMLMREEKKQSKQTNLKGDVVIGKLSYFKV